MSIHIYNENAQAQTTEEKFTEVANRGTNLGSNTIYDNTNSGLQAINVNDAIDEVIENTSDNLAPTENGTTASRTYNAGEYIVRGGVYYRVKTTIASGTSFVVGTNIEETSVGDEISTINSNLSKNTFGTFIDLTTYTYENPYIATSDGYGYLYIPYTVTNANVTLYIRGSEYGNYMLLTENADGINHFNTIFIRKGMKLVGTKSNNNCSVQFIPLE